MRGRCGERVGGGVMEKNENGTDMKRRWGEKKKREECEDDERDGKDGRGGKRMGALQREDESRLWTNREQWTKDQQYFESRRTVQKAEKASKWSNQPELLGLVRGVKNQGRGVPTQIRIRTLFAAAVT